MEQTITVTLPENIYHRIELTAKATSLSLEEVLTQSITLTLPAFESDMPLDIQADLAKLFLLSDVKLWEVANDTMPNKQQKQLETLTRLKKHRLLTPDEQLTLKKLITKAERLILHKAEAKRLLAQRGHQVFPPSNTSSE